MRFSALAALSAATTLVFATGCGPSGGNASPGGATTANGAPKAKGVGPGPYWRGMNLDQKDVCFGQKPVQDMSGQSMVLDGCSAAPTGVEIVAAGKPVSAIFGDPRISPTLNLESGVCEFMTDIVHPAHFERNCVPKAGTHVRAVCRDKQTGFVGILLTKPMLRGKRDPRVWTRSGLIAVGFLQPQDARGGKLVTTPCGGILADTTAVMRYAGAMP